MLAGKAVPSGQLPGGSESGEILDKIAKVAPDHQHQPGEGGADRESECGKGWEEKPKVRFVQWFITPA